jgi:hypothetical protein
MSFYAGEAKKLLKLLDDKGTEQEFTPEESAVLEENKYGAYIFSFARFTPSQVDPTGVYFTKYLRDQSIPEFTKGEKL